MAIYRWVIDNIMLEEADAGQIIASSYTKPFDDYTNDYGIQIGTLYTLDVNELIAIIAQFMEVTFAPVPKINTPSHMQFNRMDVDTSEFIKFITEKKRIIFQNLLKSETTINQPDQF